MAKLNKQEIKVLAQEVLNKLGNDKLKFTSQQKSKYSKIVSDYNKLQAKYESIEKEMNTIIESLEKDLNISSIWRSDMEISILENKYSKFNLPKRPTLDNLVHEVSLESLFSDKKDIKDLIQRLVTKYSK
jgi:ABC-type phosphate transport system auxiliary subunit